MVEARRYYRSRYHRYYRYYRSHHGSRYYRYYRYRRYRHHVAAKAKTNAPVKAATQDFSMRKLTRAVGRNVTWNGPQVKRWVRSVGRMAQNITRQTRNITQAANRAAQRDLQQVAAAVQRFVATQKRYDQQKQMVAMRVFQQYFLKWYQMWGCTNT